jgi:hypothetical protein
MRCSGLGTNCACRDPEESAGTAGTLPTFTIDR